MIKGTILIIGAKSEVAKAIAYHFASLGYSLQLACRESNSLINRKNDLEIRFGINVNLIEFDINSYASQNDLIANIPKIPEIAICLVGVLGNQKEMEQDEKLAQNVIRTNFEGPALILGKLANEFEKRKSGIIIGISSVAGDRGRRSNYLYGSSKAALTCFLSGLRNRLFNKNIRVITIIPGYIKSNMTLGMSLPKYITSEPEEIAVSIEKAIIKDIDVIYIKSIWKYIMLLIKIIPEKIFKRLNI